MNPQIPSAAASGTFLIGGDLPVHRLGYGTMRLVGEGAWGEPSEPAQARRVLHRAVELGVTLIDTADAYGPEIAERLIGDVLYPYPPGLVIATKGGITRQGPAKTESVGRAGYLIQCVEMSLRRLRLECIDLYQLHRIDPRTPLEESLGALKRMQEQGKIRHIGLSEVTPAEIEEASKIVKNRHHPESLQPGRPSSRADAGLVPEAGNWLPALVSQRGRETASAGPPFSAGAGPHRRPPFGHGLTALAGLAAPSLAGSAAHSRHLQSHAPPGKHCRHEPETDRKGLRGD